MVIDLQAATLDSQDVEADDSREDNQESEAKAEEKDTTDESGDSDNKAEVLEQIAEIVQKYREPSLKIEEKREDLEWRRKQVQQGADEELTKGLLPIEQGVLIDRRPVNFYSHTPEEFRALLKQLHEASKNADSGVTFDLIHELTDSYYTYQKRMDKHQEKLFEEETQLEIDEWNEIEEEVLSEAPEVKPYLRQISKWIIEEVNKRPALRTRIVTKTGKVDLIMRAIKALKIDQKMEKTVEDEPSVHRGATSRSSGAPKKSGKRIYTRDEIKKMSTADYEKYEDDITLAQREGRIK